MLLLIDNYDSFTWNLVHRLGEVAPALEVRVVRNDEIDTGGVRALAPSHIVLSPGPCTPSESGVCRDIVRELRGLCPILGVCLGHQAIGDCAGMVVRRSDTPVHGKASLVHHDGMGIFRGLPSPFEAARYHSLIVDRATVSPDYDVSAWLETGEVMGLRWKGAGRSTPCSAPLDGVQFHPESFMTPHGYDLLRNFVALGAATGIGC
ncbi:MAG: aminodeoxychorismate/anthranilate synthase component II [Planctomycetota bacterium]|nr:aminodeoxychorismate/anthranilate synthase component II [Planctomycetota bacterium]MDA1106417.1 aminodeoxychorismate/anthranilate synthase component II [Planctomycetota bacterium]